MTQVSRPWAGTTIGDAGPYTAPHWWDVWQTFQRGNGAKIGTGNVGVFYAVPGRLEATSPGANSVNIAAGAALVDGLYYDNDAVVNFAVPSAAPGNVRTDRIVIRKTFSSTIQTARLVRLVGVEVASPGPGTEPTLVQGLSRTTYWDVPVCRIAITDAGVITLTDEREYVDAIQKVISVPIAATWNFTDSIPIPQEFVPGHPLIDTKLCISQGWIDVPSDCIGNVVLSAIVCTGIIESPSNNYNVVLSIISNRYTIVAGSSTLHDGVNLDETTSVTSDGSRKLVCVLSVPNALAGNSLDISFSRDATDLNDTLTMSLVVLAYRMTYLGWK